MKLDTVPEASSVLPLQAAKEHPHGFGYRSKVSRPIGVPALSMPQQSSSATVTHVDARNTSFGVHQDPFYKELSSSPELSGGLGLSVSPRTPARYHESPPGVSADKSMPSVTLLSLTPSSSSSPRGRQSLLGTSFAISSSPPSAFNPDRSLTRTTAFNHPPSPEEVHLMRDTIGRIYSEFEKGETEREFLKDGYREAEATNTRLQAHLSFLEGFERSDQTDMCNHVFYWEGRHRSAESELEQARLELEFAAQASRKERQRMRDAWKGKLEMIEAEVERFVSRELRSAPVDDIPNNGVALLDECAQELRESAKVHSEFYEIQSTLRSVELECVSAWEEVALSEQRHAQTRIQLEKLQQKYNEDTLQWEVCLNNAESTADRMRTDLRPQLLTSSQRRCEREDENHEHPLWLQDRRNGNDAMAQCRNQKPLSPLEPWLEMSGWLSMRGARFGDPWTQWWCVLEDAGLMYYYHHSEECAKGDVPICASTQVATFCDSSQGDCPTYRVEKPFGFTLDANRSGDSYPALFYFDAGSEQCLEQWMGAIFQRIRKLQAVQVFRPKAEVNSLTDMEMPVPVKRKQEAISYAGLEAQLEVCRLEEASAKAEAERYKLGEASARAEAEKHRGRNACVVEEYQAHMERMDEWEIKDGSMKGEEIEKTKMTIKDAKIKCKNLAGCAGFYFNDYHTISEDKRVEIAFCKIGELHKHHFHTFTSFLRKKAALS